MIDYDLFSAPAVEPVAHARRTDPATSHAAARSLDAATLRQSQTAVLETIRRYGPLSDVELVTRYDQLARAMRWPLQSDSGIRSRRAELVGRGLVVPVGETKLASGRKAITWGVA